MADEGAEVPGDVVIPEAEVISPTDPVPEPDLVAVSHTPETALDENGVRYMTGRMIHRNAAGDEVPAPPQEPVRTL